MKKILIGSAFAIPILGAIAFKTNAKSNAYTTRYHVVTGVCKSFTNTLCDGPSSQPICTGVFANLSQPNCDGVTYQNETR